MALFGGGCRTLRLCLTSRNRWDELWKLYPPVILAQHRPSKMQTRFTQVPTNAARVPPQTPCLPRHSGLIATPKTISCNGSFLQVVSVTTMEEGVCTVRTSVLLPICAASQGSPFTFHLIHLELSQQSIFAASSAPSWPCDLRSLVAYTAANLKAG